MFAFFLHQTLLLKQTYRKLSPFKIYIKMIFIALNVLKMLKNALFEWQTYLFFICFIEIFFFSKNLFFNKFYVNSSVIQPGDFLTEILLFRPSEINGE